MSAPVVCVAANSLYYPEGGGHRWVYLNWALGLRALGCRVIWLEEVALGRPLGSTREGMAALRRHLAPYGLGEALALATWSGGPNAGQLAAAPVADLAEAAQADLLVSLRYGLPAAVVRRFRRSVLVDIDPVLLQVWMSNGQVEVAAYDAYVTTSEAVANGTSALIPDAGIAWQHVPPCVALEWWRPTSARPDATFTTVSHWGTWDEWLQDETGYYSNDKQDGFTPFLDLPRMVDVPLELALCLSPWQLDNDAVALRERGWRVREAAEVAATPWDYQRYIQGSLGEFSATKPSCVRLRNSWVSDRTLCYLASGRPAVVQHTGPSRLLPEREGLFRVRDIDEAARALTTIAANYDTHARLARQLAEEHFDERLAGGGSRHGARRPRRPDGAARAFGVAHLRRRLPVHAHGCPATPTGRRMAGRAVRAKPTTSAAPAPSTSPSRWNHCATGRTFER